MTAPRFEIAYRDGRTEMYGPGRELMLVINDENAPTESERRAPSTAAGAASIQLFAPAPRPDLDNAKLLETDAAPCTKVVERTIEQVKHP